MTVLAMDVGDASAGGQRREHRFTPPYATALQPESMPPPLPLPTRSSSSAELLHIASLVKRPLSVRVNEYVEPSTCLLPVAPKAISKPAVATTPLLTTFDDSSPAPDVTGSIRPVSDGGGRPADGCIFYGGLQYGGKEPRPQRPGRARLGVEGDSARDDGGSGPLPPPPPPPLRHLGLVGGGGGDRRPRSGLVVVPESRSSAGVAALPDAVLVIISEQPAPVPPAGERARHSSSGDSRGRVDSTHEFSGGGKVPPAHDAAAARPATAASSIVCVRCGKCQCRSCTQSRDLPKWSIPAPRRLVTAVAASPLGREPAERPFLPAEQQQHRWQSAVTATGDEGSFVCSDECCVDAASCLCCVQAMFSGSGCSSGGGSCGCCCCGGGADWKLATGMVTDVHPCAGRGQPMCCTRWSAMLLLAATVLPCLCLYWPLRGCMAAASGCYNCYRKRHGCRCHNGQAVVQEPSALDSSLGSSRRL